MVPPYAMLSSSVLPEGSWTNTPLDTLVGRLMAARIRTARHRHRQLTTHAEFTALPHSYGKPRAGYGAFMEQSGRKQRNRRRIGRRRNGSFTCELPSLAASARFLPEMVKRGSKIGRAS